MTTNVLWGRAWKLVALAATVAAAGGCAADASESAPDAEGRTGTTQQAFSGVATWGFGATSYTSSVIPNINDGSYTCFLTEVVGNLDAQSGAAEVRVGKSFFGSSLVLEVAPNSGNYLGATAACVSNVTNRTPVKTFSGTRVQLDSGFAASANRRCYLTAVGARANHVPEDFSGANDKLHTYKENGKWYLDGVGNVTGSARCIDVTDLGTGWWVSNGDFQLIPAPAGDVCFLSAVGGSFQSNSTTSQAKVYTSGGWWRLKGSAGKYAEGSCAR
jgi:hypothetical protein